MSISQIKNSFVRRFILILGIIFLIPISIVICLGDIVWGMIEYIVTESADFFISYYTSVKEIIIVVWKGED